MPVLQEPSPCGSADNGFQIDLKPVSCRLEEKSPQKLTSLASGDGQADHGRVMTGGAPFPQGEMGGRRGAGGPCPEKAEPMPLVQSARGHQGIAGPDLEATSSETG